MDMRLLKKFVVVLLILMVAVSPVDAKAFEVENVTLENMSFSDALNLPVDDVQEPVSDSGQEPGNDDTQEPGGDDVQEPSEPEKGTKLIIDNQNRYDGMDKTYSEGYVPRVENGNAIIVIPIISVGDIKDNVLRASLSLGDSQNSPFVYKNYEKNIPLQNASINGGSSTKDCYVASFTLELASDRCNGSYPVVLTVKATDNLGNDIEQDFTAYVTITDGKDPNAEPTTEAEPEEGPTFAPKVMVQSYKYSKENIQAGDEITAEITLVNTSETNSVKNMTVSVNAPAEYITLLSKSDSIYIDSIGAGETHVISYKYRVNASTPQGQYDLAVAMDYADADGNSYTASGKAKLPVGQTIKMQFDPLIIADSLQVADVVEAKVQAMNLGRSKVYNVRAVIEADGLKPQGTIFIGDMEAGTVATGSTQVTVSSLTGGNSLYGETEGVVTFYYEDENGKELTETMTFVTTITTPFSENQQNKPEEKPEQWWMIMAVIGGILIIFAVVMAIRRVKRRKRDAEDEIEWEKNEADTDISRDEPDANDENRV